MERIGRRGMSAGAEADAIPDAKPPRAEWMHRGQFGLMVHWLAPGPAPEKGERITDVNRAVDRFDTERFLRQFEAVGADWLIFTLGQNTGFYCSPNPVLDRFAGPGRSSRRDLALELAEGVKRRGKRFVAYLPSEVQAQSPEIHRAFAWNPEDQTEFQRRYTEFVRAYSEKFGKRLDGWWLDGCYTWPDFHNSLYDWPLWFGAARAGNPDAAVTFNDGSFCVGNTQPVTPQQDYLSGEIERLVGGRIRLGRDADSPAYLPESRFAPGTGVQWHGLLPLEGDWTHETPGPAPSSLYADAELFSFVKACRDVGGAVTLNVAIYQEGHISEEAEQQLIRLSHFLSLAKTLPVV